MSTRPDVGVHESGRTTTAAASSEPTPQPGAPSAPVDGAVAEVDRGPAPVAWHRRLADASLMAVVATVAAALPALFAGVRGAWRGWTPTGDDAYSAVRGWDLFTSNPPLLGTWSSASLYTGHEINHPGPLQFDLLAVPVRVLGHGAGTAVGIALVNAVAIAMIGWLVHRRAGPAAATLAAAGSALLAWSLGSELLYDPWSQHAPLVPFALFLVAAWAAVDGDRVGLPVMVVAGSYAFHTHLSYAVLVPGVAVFAAAMVVARLLVSRHRDPHGWAAGGRQRSLRWLAITAGVTVACWAQPLYQQLTADGEGNIAGLLRSADASVPTPGFRKALVAFGGTVALPPAWLPPSFGSPSFRIDGSGRPAWLCALALLMLVTGLVVLGWRAWSRRSSAVAAGCLTALVALGLGWVSTIQMPIRFGMAPTYARFMWPLGMAVWLAVGVAVLDEVRARRWGPRRGRRPARSASQAGVARLALPGLVLALVAGVATLPTVDNGTGTPPWTVDAVQALDDEVVAAFDDQGPVLVDLRLHLSVGAVGPAFLVTLQDAGIPFVVDDQHLVSQLGEDRRYDAGDAEVRMVVKAGVDARAEPGEQLVAEWSPLSAAEEAELDGLSAELRRIVVEHGVPLRDGGVEAVRAVQRDELLDDIAEARSRPEEIVDYDTLHELWAGPPARYVDRPALDQEVFPPALMDRWSALIEAYDQQPISVYRAPIA